MTQQKEEYNEDKLLEYYCKILQDKKELAKEPQVWYNYEEFDAVKGED